MFANDGTVALGWYKRYITVGFVTLTRHIFLSNVGNCIRDHDE